MIWDIALWMLALAASAYLAKYAMEWWVQGTLRKSICNPVRHRQRMAELRAQIEEAREDLAYYQNTPDWLDQDWPICDNLDLSSDGEYCRRCYRQANEHGIRTCAA